MLIMKAPQAWIKTSFLIGLIAVLTACGGGGSSNPEPPAPDTTPNTFTFENIIDAEPGSTQTSNTITISGIDSPTSISITGGQYAIGSNAPTSSAGTITNGQTVTISLTASKLTLTEVTASLTIGGVTGSFSVTTIADTTPDEFSFTAVTNVELDSVQTSNPVTVSGVDIAVPIRITGGEYAIGDGEYTDTEGTVEAGQVVTVQVIAAAGTNTTESAMLTIGDVAAEFEVSTIEDTTAPEASITFPPAMSLTEGSTILVRGTASDDLNEITEVNVGSFAATSDDGFATWVAEVTLAPGESVLSVSATDAVENEGVNLGSVTIHRAETLDAAFPSDAVEFVEPQTVAVDKSRNRALVVDVELRSVFTVDLATGVRSILSENKEGDEFPLMLERTDFNAAGIVVDVVNDRAYLGSSAISTAIAGPTILNLDLATGARSAATETVTAYPTAFALKPSIGLGSIILGKFDEGALFSWDNNSVDSSWQPITWSSLGLPNSENPLETMGGVAVDSARNRALVTTLSGENHLVMAVDLSEENLGVRTPFSTSVIPNTDVPFSDSGDYILTSISIDEANDRALLADRGKKAIFDLALENGARKILSNATTPNTDNIFLDPFTVHVEADMSYGLVVDKERKALVAVDLVNGQRVIISKSSTGS